MKVDGFNKVIQSLEGLAQEIDHCNVTTLEDMKQGFQVLIAQLGDSNFPKAILIRTKINILTGMIEARVQTLLEEEYGKDFIEVIK